MQVVQGALQRGGSGALSQVPWVGRAPSGLMQSLSGPWLSPSGVAANPGPTAHCFCEGPSCLAILDGLACRGSALWTGGRGHVSPSFDVEH